MRDLTGKKLGRYILKKLIGRGGMAVVYRAHDPKLKRDVAIKIPLTNLLEDGRFEERFISEGQSLAKMDHPNIVKVFDMDTFNGIPFMVMELLEGKTLEQHIRAKTLPDLQTLLSILAQIASGLDHVHGNHIVHRDLKPSNVMLAGNTAKIMDFGINKTDDPDQTLPLEFLGTYAYAGPEQFNDVGSVSCKTDIFALAIIALVLLTKDHPFNGQKCQVTINAILNEAPKISVRLDVDQDKWLAVFQKALNKNPEGRYSTATHFIRKLKASFKQPHAALPRRVIPTFSAPAPSHFLRIMNGPQEGRTYRFSNAEQVILGRDKAAWTFPFDKFVNPSHAIIRLNNGRFEVLDIHSEYGTYVGRHRAPQKQWTTMGEHVVVGSTLLTTLVNPSLDLNQQPVLLENFLVEDTFFDGLAEFGVQGNNTVDALSLFLYLLTKDKTMLIARLLGLDVGMVQRLIIEGMIYKQSKSWINIFLKKNRSSFQNKKVVLTPLVCYLLNSYFKQQDLVALLTNLLLNTGPNLVHPLLDWPENGKKIAERLGRKL